MQALPLRPQELAKRIPGRKTDADAVGPQPLDGRGAQVLGLTDGHRGESLRCRAAARQAEARI